MNASLDNIQIHSENGNKKMPFFYYAESLLWSVPYSMDICIDYMRTHTTIYTQVKTPIVRLYSSALQMLRSRAQIYHHRNNHPNKLPGFHSLFFFFFFFCSSISFTPMQNGVE